jgi:hypothetical protein
MPKEIYPTEQEEEEKTPNELELAVEYPPLQKDKEPQPEDNQGKEGGVQTEVIKGRIS